MSEIIRPKEIIYSKRKSIALILNDNAELIVRAPLHTKSNDIERFINLKQTWLIQKKKDILNNKIAPLKGESNEKIRILDTEYTIQLCDGKRVKIVGQNLYLPKSNSLPALKNYIIRLSKSYLSSRTKELGDMYGISYNNITISSARTRWGSCSSTNNLSFTYKLILCPKRVIDYIIIHELTHVKVKNHSKAFWHKVEQIMPDYKECEKYLKTYRSIINVI